jgi:large subunit ribosomal protein L4
MVQATIYNLAGEEVEKIELDEAIFGIEPNHAVIHQAVVRQQANARRGTHDTKTRADVSGGGKKPWRQKGTGRARQGSNRSPQWRHGGVVFGPHPRSYEKDMPRKMRRLAIRGVLSGKMADGQLVLVDNFDTLEPRTKSMVDALTSLQIGGKKALIFTTGTEANLRLAAGNLPNVKMQSAHLLSIEDMLNHDVVVLPKASLDVVVGILGNTGGRTKLTLRGVAARPATNGAEAKATTAAPATKKAKAAPAAKAAPSKKATVEAPEEAAPTTAKKATAAVSAVEEAPEETKPAAKRKSAAKTESAAPAPIIAGNVVISTVHYKDEEYVELRNENDLPVDLTGWVIRDKNDADQSFTFAEGTELKPGSTTKVFTSPNHKQSFESKRPIWNDKGDVAELLGSDGKVISTFAYGSYAEDAGDSETTKGEGSKK